MKQILPLRSLGKSDMMITPIGLGCWQFSKHQNMAGKFWPKMEAMAKLFKEHKIRIVRVSNFSAFSAYL